MNRSLLSAAITATLTINSPMIMSGPTCSCNNNWKELEVGKFYANVPKLFTFSVVEGGPKEGVLLRINGKLEKVEYMQTKEWGCWPSQELLS